MTDTENNEGRKITVVVSEKLNLGWNVESDVKAVELAAMEQLKDLDTLILLSIASGFRPFQLQGTEPDEKNNQLVRIIAQRIIFVRDNDKSGEEARSANKLSREANEIAQKSNAISEKSAERAGRANIIAIISIAVSFLAILAAF